MNLNFLQKIRKKFTQRIPKKFKDHLISLWFYKKRLSNYQFICKKLKNLNKVIEIGGAKWKFLYKNSNLSTNKIIGYCKLL